MMRGQKKHQLS